MNDAQGTTPVRDPSRLVTLRRMRVMEAQLARAKLESEGIPCDVAEQEMAITDPLVISEVRLMVRVADLALADEILSRPADEGTEGEYADEAWRCPQCHRRTVDLVPLSSGQRSTRAGCLIFAVVPMLLAIIQQLIENDALGRALDEIFKWGSLPWIVALLTCTLLIVSTHRRKRCRECGNEWEGEAEEE
jgi:hypothetical protein